jgi:hypothetical protein
MDTLNDVSGIARYYRGKCQRCKSSTYWRKTEEEAAAAWDKRAEPHKKPPAPAPVPGSAGFVRVDKGPLASDYDLFLRDNTLYTRDRKTGRCYRYGAGGCEAIKKAEYDAVINTVLKP